MNYYYYYSSCAAATAAIYVTKHETVTKKDHLQETTLIHSKTSECTFNLQFQCHSCGSFLDTKCASTGSL